MARLRMRDRARRKAPTAPVAPAPAAKKATPKKKAPKKKKSGFWGKKADI